MSLKSSLQYQIVNNLKKELDIQEYDIPELMGIIFKNCRVKTESVTGVRLSKFGLKLMEKSYTCYHFPLNNFIIFPKTSVPLNIFGVNSVTDEMIAYSSDNATVGGLNEQEVTSMNFNGPIAEYDGGTVYMAVGYESRTEYGETLQDSLIIQGLLTDRSGLNTSGAYSLEEVYAE